MINSSGVIASRSLVCNSVIRLGVRVPQSAESVCDKANWRRVKPIEFRRGFWPARMSGRAESVTSPESGPVQEKGAEFKVVNVVIKGKVQGVFYRKWTTDTAKNLNLNGWVRNRQDGSVEAVFSGVPSAVDNMVEKCHSGPSGAKVTSVNVSKCDSEVPQGFEQKPTVW